MCKGVRYMYVAVEGKTRLELVGVGSDVVWRGRRADFLPAGVGRCGREDLLISRLLELVGVWRVMW